MSTERTLRTIQEEYTQLAAKIGHAHVQIATLNAEIPRLHEAVQALTLESASLSAKAPVVAPSDPLIPTETPTS
jgi:hypothetical protein